MPSVSPWIPACLCVPMPGTSLCPVCPKCPHAQCVPMDPCVLLCVSMPHVSPSVSMPGASLWPMSPHALCVPVDLCVLVCPCPVCPNACCILVPHMSLCPACPRCPHAQCVPMGPCMLLCVSMPRMSPGVPMPGASPCPLCPYAVHGCVRVHRPCVLMPRVSPSVFMSGASLCLVCPHPSVSPWIPAWLCMCPCVPVCPHGSLCGHVCVHAPGVPMSPYIPMLGVSPWIPVWSCMCPHALGVPMPWVSPSIPVWACMCPCPWCLHALGVPRSAHILMPGCPHALGVPMDPCVVMYVSLPQVSPCPGCPRGSLRGHVCVPAPGVPMPWVSPWIPAWSCVCPCPRCPHALGVPVDPCVVMYVSLPQVSPCPGCPCGSLRGHVCVPAPGVPMPWVSPWIPVWSCVCPCPRCPHALGVPVDPCVVIWTLIEQQQQQLQAKERQIEELKAERDTVRRGGGRERGTTGG
ncbi:mucin-5AC-like [Falco biarmicus]|uniref:mucin-5AC-like n=1 Tax=Falco biarmicus TaxID=345155 RepID=UPI0024BC0AB3|nr:mucin-5AC-like [Falco biarmicus]